MELTKSPSRAILGKEFDNAILELAVDLTLDVYGGEELKSIAMRAYAGEEIKEDLKVYLEKYFTHKGKQAPRKGKTRASRKTPEAKSKRKQMRAEYVRVQSLYQSSRLCFANKVLDEPQVNGATDHKAFIDFWRRTMTEMPHCAPVDIYQPKEILGDIWDFVFFDRQSTRVPYGRRGPPTSEAKIPIIFQQGPQHRGPRGICYPGTPSFWKSNHRLAFFGQFLTPAGPNPTNPNE